MKNIGEVGAGMADVHMDPAVEGSLAAAGFDHQPIVRN